MDAEHELDKDSAREIVETLSDIVFEHGDIAGYGEELVILSVELFYEDGLVMAFGFDPSRKRGPLYNMIGSPYRAYVPLTSERETQETS